MLAHQLQLYVALKERLKEQYDLADEDEALLDTLEGATNLGELTQQMIREALAFEAKAEGLERLIARMEQRRCRLMRRAERLRQNVLGAMIDAGLKTLAAEDFTASVRSSPKTVHIICEDLLPERFVQTKIQRSPDKRALKEALERGEHVDGAKLTNGSPVLYIRC